MGVLESIRVLSWYSERQGKVTKLSVEQSRHTTRTFRWYYSVIGVSYRASAHQFILTAACTAHMDSSLAMSGRTMTPSRSHSHHYHTNNLDLTQCYRRHVPPLHLFVVYAAVQTQHTVHPAYIVIRHTLTSLRTAAGYGRGARVRTLVPSRILPSASPANPNSCSQEDLRREETGGRELPARWEGVTEDGRWMDRETVGCVCSSRLSSPLLSLPASLRSAVSSRALKARGDWSGPGNWYSGCGERGYNGWTERKRGREAR